MTIDELIRLHDSVVAQEQNVGQASGLVQKRRLQKAALENEIAELTQELSRTRKPAQRKRLSRELEGLQRKLTEKNLQLETAETALLSAQHRLAQDKAAYEDQVARLISQLDSSVPLTLLPVRLETKFIPIRDEYELRIRVFPDDIHVNAHQRILTAEESERGAEFHSAIGKHETERQAWSELAGRFGPHRAAWVARVTDPSRGADSDGSVETEFKGEHAATLPDLWYFFGYSRANPNVERIFAEHGAPIKSPLPLWYDPQATSEEDAQKSVAWLKDWQEAKKVGMGHSVWLSKVDAARLGRLVVIGVKATVDATQSSSLFQEILTAHQYTWGLSFIPQGTPTNNTSEGHSGYQERDPRFNTSFKVERTPIQFAEGQDPLQDGLLAAKAFGYPTPAESEQVEDFVFAHVQGADNNDQFDAAQMNRALWPASLGYFLKQMTFPWFLMSVFSKKAWIYSMIGGPLFFGADISHLLTWACRFLVCVPKNASPI